MAARMQKKTITLTRNTLHVLDPDTALPLVVGGNRRPPYPRTSETARRGPTGGREDQ